MRIRTFRWGIRRGSERAQSKTCWGGTTSSGTAGSFGAPEGKRVAGLRQIFLEAGTEQGAMEFVARSHRSELAFAGSRAAHPRFCPGRLWGGSTALALNCLATLRWVKRTATTFGTARPRARICERHFTARVKVEEQFRSFGSGESQTMLQMFMHGDCLEMNLRLDLWAVPNHQFEECFAGE